jgi:hypothetical protein
MTQKPYQVISRQVGHCHARALRCAGDVRREHDVWHSKEVRVDAWLVFKHVQTCCGDGPRAQSCSKCGVVDDAAARDVDQGCRGLHQGQLVGSDCVAGSGGVGQSQDHVVSGGEKICFGRVDCLAALLRRRVQAAAVVINDFHSETERRPLGNRLANATHSYDAQSTTMNFTSSKPECLL